MRSARYPSDRPRRPRWRRVVVWILAFLPLAAYLALDAFAWRKVREEERAWAAAFGPWSELGKRYPLQRETPAAAHLRTLAATLVEPSTASQPDPGRKPLLDIVRQYRQYDSNRLVALPPAAVLFLDQKRQTLDEMESVLLGPEPVSFERRPARVDDPPFPVAGYVIAQAVFLGRALNAAQAGEEAAASRTLEAGDRYRRAACAEPEKLARLACLNSGLGFNAIARSIGRSPDTWSSRVDVPQASVTDAHRRLVAAWLQVARASVFRGRAVLDRAERDRSLGPWVRDVVVAPWVRLEIGFTSFGLRKQLLRARERTCPDRTPASLPRTPLVPWIAESIDAARDLLLEAEYRLDAERTRLVLEALDTRMRTGSWPAPSDTPSQACAGTVWTVRPAANDRLVVEPSPDPAAGSDAAGRWTYTVSAPAVGAR